MAGIYDFYISNSERNDMASMKYDRIIIGAGLYGLYSALFCGRKGESVLVLE